VAAFLGDIGRGEVDGDPFWGRAKPSAASAARTRSRDSATALSGNPTTVKAGSPETIVT
jgi:hypothetical protein